MMTYALLVISRISPFLKGRSSPVRASYSYRAIYVSTRIRKGKTNKTSLKYIKNKLRANYIFKIKSHIIRCDHWNIPVVGKCHFHNNINNEY